MAVNPRATGPLPHAISKLWAFFVLGILVTTMTFVVASWQGLELATSHRLAVMAAAVARVERSYLQHTTSEMRHLQVALQKTTVKARPRILRRYLADHPHDVGIALLDTHDHTLVSVGPFQPNPKTLYGAIPPETTRHPLPHHLSFSAPFAERHGRYVLFVRAISPHQSLIFERSVLSWPHLRGLISKLPPHFHIFIVARNGTLEYRLPHPETAAYGSARRGALMQTLAKAVHRNSGAFSGQTYGGWRLGAYQSTRYGLVAAVSLPLKNLIQTFAHRLEIPLLLIFILMASAALYYHYARVEIARAEALQDAADRHAREARVFAEQQRDFYLAVSELNQFIIRHPDPERLFAETCRIIIAYTGLLFAWIGRVETSGNIRVVAFSEKRPLGIDWFRCVFTTDPTQPEGLGTAGRAVRSGHIEITDDLAHDNRFTPWRSMHDAAGTQSAAALPIRTKAGTVAILALGSEQLSLFSPPLVHLLEGLAQDLAFSLEDTEREQQLAYQARHDVLTGLDNRTLFRQRLEEAIARPPSLTGGFAIAILDLDGFKGINDQFGHIAGDELLREIASRIRATIAPGTTAARLGGDEFGILFSPIADREQAIYAIEAIRWALDGPFVGAGHEQLAVAVSIGVSLFPEDGNQVDDLIRRADLALYEAKRLGKNIFRFFTPALEERLLNRQRLQHDFTNALRDQVLLLYFQPQVEIATGRVRSLEALLRWPRPDGKIWAPGEYFDAITQDSDLMRILDVYVLEQAFVAIRYLAEHDVRLPVAVNIHGPHLLHPDFLKDLHRVIKENRDLSHYLEIEVTETGQLADLVQASTILSECRALGVAVALDDFGTGYASLNYLQKLPCDILKIDQSFVADMG
ncbi:MAG: bifunctional diguanylate cyclase/phosphodiesterase, partial [Acidiferrobacter sp.]